MRRVSANDPFSMSAEEFNSHQVAAAFVAAQQGRHGIPSAVHGNMMDRNMPWVVNDTDYSIRAFSCVFLQYSASMDDRSDFIAKTPLKVGATGDSTQPILITQDGMPTRNSATRAVMSGVTPAWVDFGTGDDFVGYDCWTAGPWGAQVVEGIYQCNLKAGYGGARIISQPGGEGVKLCCIEIETGPQIVTGRTTGWIYARSGDVDAEEKISKSTYFPFKAPFSASLCGVDIPPDTLISATRNRDDGKYYITSAGVNPIQYGVMTKDWTAPIGFDYTLYEDNISFPQLGSNVTAKAYSKLFVAGDKILANTKVVAANVGNGYWEIICVKCD